MSLDLTRTNLAPLAPLHRPLSPQPDKLTKRLHATLEEARTIANMVRELGVALVGNQAPEPMRDTQSSSSARGLFETIASQADEIDRRFAEIRSVLENIRRQI